MNLLITFIDKVISLFQEILDMIFGRTVSRKNIDDMGGREFERFLQAELQKAWFEVTFTNHFDFWVDLIASKWERKVGIQAKCHKTWIGIDAVQKVYAGKVWYNCNEAWVITNQLFSPDAKKLANKLGVKLIGEIKNVGELGKVVN